MSPLAVLGDYWLSLVAFALFGLLHSIGAREPFKAALSRWTSPFFVEHFWRLVYFALSYLGYYQVLGRLHWGLHPDGNDGLIDFPDQLWEAITVVHLGSVVMLYTAFLQSDFLEFVGFKQAWRGVLAFLGQPGRQQPSEVFGTQRLEVRGVYGWVRHPMLVGGLLFLLTSGVTLNTLIFTAMYTSYMLIGGWYEEQRLVRIFGDDYRAYQSRVGAYVPRIWRRLA